MAEDKTFVCFVEDNEWEGEVWHFHVPTENNVEAIEKLREVLKDLPGFWLDEKTFTEKEVDVLVENAGGSYMDDQQKLEGILQFDDTLSEDALFDLFYKGGIRDCMK